MFDNRVSSSAYEAGDRPKVGPRSGERSTETSTGRFA